MEDLTGKQLGPYQVIAPLGEGGMATVYQGYQPSVDRYVALKVLPHQFAAEPEFVGRFKQEAKVIAGLEHPHILPIYDYGEAEGYLYIVMRYVEGGTVATLLRDTPIPLSKTCKIVAQIADALDYAHARGVVHRDVKPGNVLMDEQGNCLLTDFGIAKMLEGAARFTVTGSFIGTPTYASPEQAQGLALDGRSDIYSLGVMLYEMVTGHPPFDAPTPMGLLIKHVHEPVPPPRALNPAIPVPVEQVIRRALSKNPAERFQTAGELARSLAAAVQGAPVSPVVVGGPTRPIPASARPSPPFPQPRRRIPAWGWVLGILAALCGVAAVFLVGATLVGNLLRGTATRPTATATVTSIPFTATAPSPGTPAPATASPTTGAAPAPTATAPSPGTPAPAGTPMPIQGYGIPLSGPVDLVYHNAQLYMLFAQRLVKLEQVEAEGRFRAAEQVVFPSANALTWDATRGQYWVVCGGSAWNSKEIDLVDPAGNTIATYSVPEVFAGDPGYVAWDGAFLWATSTTSTLYKLRIPDAGNELQIVDSYAASTGSFSSLAATGLTWDGEALWLLIPSVLTKLDQAAQPVCKIELSQADPQPQWYGWRGVAWDGQRLWVAHDDANKLYRVDPALCQ